MCCVFGVWIVAKNTWPGIYTNTSFINNSIINSISKFHASNIVSMLFNIFLNCTIREYIFYHLLHNFITLFIHISRKLDFFSKFSILLIALIRTTPNTQIVL